MAKHLSSRKLFAFITLSVFAGFCFAEDIPTGYYNDIAGKSDSVLKSTLSRICRGGERYSYGTNEYHNSDNPPEWMKGDFKAYGTWHAFPTTDVHDDGTVWDMYSNNVRYYPVNDGSGCNLNIEHCFPKSLWGSDNNNAYKDLYHLNPSDAKANQTGKSAYPLGVVDSIVKWSNDLSKQGYMKGHPQHRVFEPADVYKGDFARAWFYIATCYEDFEWVFTSNNYGQYTLNPASYKLFQPWLYDLLIEWHRNDPVSRKEIERQDAISSIQHNRNPFIDYPELAEYIWGRRAGESVDFDSLTLTADTARYRPVEDYTNFRVYEAAELTNSSFTARWLPWNRPLRLEVFRRLQAETFDTLFAMPAVTKSIIDKTDFITHNGALNTNAAGNSASLMGTSSNDGAIILNRKSYPAGAVLRMCVSKYYNASSAELTISARNTDSLQLLCDTTYTTNDEWWLDVELPFATDSIVILSVGGSTSKRADMLKIFVLQKMQDEVLEMLVDEEIPVGVGQMPLSADVLFPAIYPEIPTEQDKLTFVYRLTPEGGLKSREISTSLYVDPTDIEKPTNTITVEKYVSNGRLFIRHLNATYDVLGRRL